jgi:hypothetical protein
LAKGQLPSRSISPAAGRLAVAGFRPGTDKLDLLLTADERGAGILATATRDAFGVTVMTVAPGVTLVLDGVLPRQLRTAIFISAPRMARGGRETVPRRRGADADLRLGRANDGRG